MSLRSAIMKTTASRPATRYLSSQAGPSKPPVSPKITKSKTLPNSKLPIKTLRNLVNLYHKSSTFLHNPSQEASTGFLKIFNAGSMGFDTYDFLQTQAEALQFARQGSGLVEKGRASSSTGVRFSESGDDGENLGVFREPAPTLKNVWKNDPPWSKKEKDSAARYLSDRELMVKEALCGTFERVTDTDMVAPDLDGVLEYLEAKGLSLEEVDKAWRERNEVVGAKAA